VLSKDAAQFQFGRAHQLEEFKVALRNLRVHVDVHGNLSRWGVATPHSEMQDRIRQELNAAVYSCSVSESRRVPIPNKKDDEIDSIFEEISELESTDTTDITHPEIAPQNEPAPPDPSPSAQEVEFLKLAESPALLEMTHEEAIKSLMAAMQPDHPRRANEDAARAATAAAVSRQSAFRPCLPPITELTNPTPAPSTRTEQQPEETPPKRKADEQSQTNKDTPPQKKPAKPKGKPRAKAKKADETPKAREAEETPATDAPQPAKSQPENGDVKCGKCGSGDAEHPKYGEMLLCSARIGGAYCTAGLHVTCASLKKVPKDKWYCAEHATTGARCPLGCECQVSCLYRNKHGASPKSRARRKCNNRGARPGTAQEPQTQGRQGPQTKNQKLVSLNQNRAFLRPTPHPRKPTYL
jgi:chemotaxis protein histidine kinase CheA